MIADHRVISFVRDDFLIEPPDRGGDVEKADVLAVVNLLCQVMQETASNIPTSFTYLLTKRWSKATALMDKNGGADKHRSSSTCS